MEYLVFDIATVRYRYNATRTTMSAFAATGELLSVVDLAPGCSTKEAAYLACDAALRSARLLRAETRYAVAFYNPYSADVCVGPALDAKIYTNRTPLDIPPNGAVARVNGAELAVEADSPYVLHLVSPTLASTSRALAAHQI